MRTLGELAGKLMNGGIGRIETTIDRIIPVSEISKRIYCGFSISIGIPFSVRHSYSVLAFVAPNLERSWLVKRKLKAAIVR